jgi:acetyl-CoA carboxylase biotin carboxyl carrier protein
VQVDCSTVTGRHRDELGSSARNIGSFPVSKSLDAIKRVVEAFERSDWSEIDVRSRDVRVHLSKAAPNGPPTTTPGPTAPAGDRAAVEPDVPATALPNPPTGVHLVVSPSPGIFWRSPEPGFPPFADVGHRVDASATVCIVEVMKLMNHVKAGVTGEVVAVYCENGVAVQKEQALFAIAPSGSS